MIINKPRRPEFTSEEAQTIASDLYNIAATASELPSERDQNFHLVSSDGLQYVLKIANSAEDRNFLVLQNEAMKRLSDGGLAAHTPQVYPTTSGQAIAEIDGPGGAKHCVRLLSFLSGTPLAKVTPHTPELLEDFGHLLGKMSKALEDFAHSAADRDFHWDIKNASSVISKHRSDIADPRQQNIVDHFLNLFESVVVPRQAGLRTSVIHNDANDYNVLVLQSENDPAGHKISGIVDYGDSVFSHTVNELAVALAYTMLDKIDPLKSATSVIRGYHEIYPLREEELEVLFPLACIRPALSVTIAAYQKKQEPDNEYLGVTERPAWALLERLMNINHRWAHYRFRAACGLTPHPNADGFSDWASNNSDRFGCVFSSPLKKAPTTVLDLSISSPALDAIAFGERAVFTSELLARIKAADGKVTIGRYNEARRHAICAHPSIPKTETEPRRAVHLGIDLFTSPGIDVLAVCDGEIVGLTKNGEDTAVILSHESEPGQIRFYTIFRYLSPESIEGLETEQRLKKGERIGTVGDSIVPPHLHFQSALDLLDYGEKLPGAATPDERDIWTSICPDPNLILQIPRHRFPAVGRASAEILDVRRDVIGKSLSIAYRRPLKIVRGRGQYLYHEDGRAFLDGVNNVCHVGHCHPKVVEAARRQMTVLNTNTRYLHDNLVDYAERLCSTMPDPLSVCFFVCSGSEANELALRLARTHSGGTDYVVVDGAYHGNTTSLVEISPYKFDGPGGSGAPDHVHKVPMPDPYRGLHRGRGSDIGTQYANHVGETFDRLKQQDRKPAAFICESLLGCGGQIVLPDGYMHGAFRHVHEAGAVSIADEVQVGFGRVGTHFWGFETQNAVPDIVTLGKPIGNGHPLGAVITTPEIAASFETGMEYFNTFGGNPVSCAIGMAVLDVIENEMLQQNALTVGQHLLNRLNDLKDEHAIIGDVRGRGLFIGVELVLDRESLAPATECATYIINRMKDHGILLSTDGPLENVLKIKPPILFTKENADYLVDTLDNIMQHEVRI